MLIIILITTTSSASIHCSVALDLIDDFGASRWIIIGRKLVRMAVRVSISLLHEDLVDINWSKHSSLALGMISLWLLFKPLLTILIRSE